MSKDGKDGKNDKNGATKVVHEHAAETAPPS